MAVHQDCMGMCHSLITPSGSSIKIDFPLDLSSSKSNDLSPPPPPSQAINNDRPLIFSSFSTSPNSSLAPSPQWMVYIPQGWMHDRPKESSAWEAYRSKRIVIINLNGRIKSYLNQSIVDLNWNMILVETTKFFTEFLFYHFFRNEYLETTNFVS